MMARARENDLIEIQLAPMRPIIDHGVGCLIRNELDEARKTFAEATASNAVLASNCFGYAIKGNEGVLLKAGRSASLFFMYWGKAVQALRAVRLQDPHREAHGLYTQAIALDKTNLEAYLLRAQNAYFLDMEYMEDLIDDYLVVLSARDGSIVLNEGALADARLICSTIRYAKPKNIAAKLGTALALCKLNKFEEALALFLEVIQLSRAGVDIKQDYLQAAYYNAGTTLARLGRVEEAQAYLLPPVVDPLPILDSSPATAAAAAASLSEPGNFSNQSTSQHSSGLWSALFPSQRKKTVGDEPGIEMIALDSGGLSAGGLSADEASDLTPVSLRS